MLVCPLLCDFRESNKVAKFNGANIEFQIFEISTSLKNSASLFKIKGGSEAKNFVALRRPMGAAIFTHVFVM